MEVVVTDVEASEQAFIAQFRVMRVARDPVALSVEAAE